MPAIDIRTKARLSDAVEVRAFRALWEAAPPALAARLGLRIEEVADATLLIAPGLPTPMFNRAIGLGLEQPATLARVDAIASAYRRAGVSNWWLHWNPHARPAGFDAALESHGFRAAPRRSWAKMWRSPLDPPQVETALNVEPASGDAALQVARIAVAAFEMPTFMEEWLALLCTGAWRMYAVRDGEAIVGGGCLYLDAEAGWLGVAAVAPSHRGRGGQAALMARRIADAGRAGALHVITETGEPTAAGEANPSLANMKRCGFETVASRLNYAAPA
jgi:GNAT superfamily N-acetyltransferase